MAAGQLGGTPPVKGQQLNASIIAQTRLTSADEFSKILLKVNQDGSQVRLRDVARKWSWAARTTTLSRSSTASRHLVWVSNWRPALTPDTATAIRAELKKMEPFFPSGLKNRLSV